jgi:hypothetical protein
MNRSNVQRPGRGGFENDGASQTERRRGLKRRRWRPARNAEPRKPPADLLGDRSTPLMSLSCRLVV